MPIGTGPYYVCESIPNDHFTWCKNEYYWQEGKPHIDKIIVLWIPDREALKARFVAGDIALALIFGLISALRQYSWLDMLVTTFSFIGLSTPIFWSGLILILIFSVRLN